MKTINDSTQRPEDSWAGAPAQAVKPAIVKRLFSSVSLVWEIPLACFSWLFFHYIKAVVGYSLKRHLAKESRLRWKPLSVEQLEETGAMAVYMTMGPRWNTHAAIASAGPLSVRQQLAVCAATAEKSARKWTIVVYSFPGGKIVGRIGSLAAHSEGGWQVLELPPGMYSLALRYYDWRDEAELPEVKVDGQTVLQPCVIPRNINEFYSRLRKKNSWFYRWLHYYVFVMLRLRRLLPAIFVRREYLPVGDPGTFFLYDFIRAGESLHFDIEHPLLKAGPIYFTQYDRSSFPVRWHTIGEEKYVTPPSEQDGFYLVRILEVESINCENFIRVRAQPQNRPPALD